MLYKRRDFPVLKIGSRQGLLKPYLSTTFPGSNDPILLASTTKNRDGYTLFSYSRIGEVNRLPKVVLQITALVFISGAALILLAPESFAICTTCGTRSMLPWQLKTNSKP